MGINRPLRDELCDALIRCARQELTPEQFLRVAETIRAQLAHATGKPQPQDPGCAFAADHFIMEIDIGAHDFSATPRSYTRLRRYVAFLRSDVDVELELELGHYQYERVENRLRRRLLRCYVMVVIVAVIVCASRYGPLGLLVWPLAATPMWVGMIWSVLPRGRHRHADFAPFHSRQERDEHDHLADRVPTLPRPEVVSTRRAIIRRLRAGLSASIVVVTHIPIVAGFCCFMSLFWPSLLGLNWVQQERKTRRDPSETL